MKIIKKIVCVFLALTMTISIVGCSSSTEKSKGENTTTPETTAATTTIVDHNGNTVTVPSDVKRIVVCDILPLPSVLSIFFNSADKIVGMSETSLSAAENSLLSELYPEILNVNTGFIKGSSVNFEELAGLKPDVVFYSASNPELGTQLTQAGFSAVAISVNKWEYNCIETLNNWIALLSQIFPQEEAKTKLVADYSKETYDMIQSRVANLSDSERVKVMFLFKCSDTTIMTSGKRFFGQWWADAIGAVNVAEELTTDNSVEVNMEQIYKWNPELLLITNFTTAQPKDIFQNTIGAYDWSGIDAVKNKQVYKMPLGMYRSYTPGVDTPITLMWLAKTVYPSLFEDIDITAETKKYYKQVFNITLTDEQADAIFNPASAGAAGF